MSLETGTPDPTAEAADTTPDTGTAPATTAPATQGTAAAGQPQRTYTQADVDAAYAEARKWKREQEARLREQYERQYERSTPQPEVDPALRAQIESLVGPIVAPIKQQAVEVSLDRAVGALGKKYPEFGDEAKVREIFGAVVDLGLDRASHLPIETVLELGYRHWKHDEMSKALASQPDIETVKKQAADEAIKAYTAKKVDTASKTPKPEGAGQGAVSSPKKITKRDEYEAALEAAIARIE